MFQQTASVPPGAAAQPTAPALAPGQVMVGTTPLTSPQAVFQAFRAQRRELANQMDGLENARDDLSQQLTQTTVTGADRKGLEARVTSLDERIATVDKQIAEADAQLARAAAIPGAAVELPPPRRTGPPEEVFVLSGMLIVCILLPLTIAYARRIWRRGAQVVSTLPRELSDRLLRVEQSVEATAIEIERIGEGQRFMTRLFTESSSQALKAGGVRDQAATRQP